MSIFAFPVHEQETSMRSVNIDFGSTYSIILSTWNFYYFLQLQSTKMISFSLCEFAFVRFISSMELLSKSRNDERTIRSTETIPIALTNPAREHYCLFGDVSTYVCHKLFLVRYKSEWPPFGKELPVRLTVCSLCRMSKYKL